MTRRYMIALRDGTQITDMGPYQTRTRALQAALELAGALCQMHDWEIARSDRHPDYIALVDANGNTARSLEIEPTAAYGTEHTFVCGCCAQRELSAEARHHGKMLVCAACADILARDDGLRVDGTGTRTTTHLPLRPRHDPFEW